MRTLRWLFLSALELWRAAYLQAQREQQGNDKSMIERPVVTRIGVPKQVKVKDHSKVLGKGQEKIS